MVSGISYYLSDQSVASSRQELWAVFQTCQFMAIVAA